MVERAEAADTVKDDGGLQQRKDFKSSLNLLPAKQ